MRVALGLIALWVVAGTGTDLLGQGNSRNVRADRETRTERDRGTNVDINITLGSEELRIIHDWFGNSTNLAGLPPGLAKRDTLPPGLQRQLQRNGTLPPGLEKKIHRLPWDLESRLPSRRSGVSRIVIGGNVILMEDATQLILDIAALF